MGNYTIPEHPIYDEEIRKLENSDPANAELTFDPLFSKIITNVASVKRSVDKTATSIDELGTAARKNVGTGANDVAIGNHNHDLAYTAKSHSTDTTLHITSVERTSWNNKETPSGAQTKADSAKSSAIATAATDATAKANTAEANAKAISSQALNEHVADGFKHITTVERNSWNGKANTNVASTSVDGLMAKGDKVKLDGIAIQANNYVHPTSHSANMITGLPSSLPANGGNAATVNGKMVESNVPTNAKFTDTVYTHPNDVNTRHVTDTEKATWNGKASTAMVTTTANGLMASADKVKLNGIATSANNYSHPASHPASMITGLPSSLPASGGNAATVNGKTVESNVPVNAKFTDTVYTHPNDVNTRHVSDTEKTSWNAKANTTVATASVNGLMAAVDKTKLDGVAVQANKTIITNNLATVSAGTALDAVQGKVLAEQIGGLSGDIDACLDKVGTFNLSGDLNTANKTNKWYGIDDSKGVLNTPPSGCNNSALYVLGADPGAFTQMILGISDVVCVRSFVKWATPQWTPWKEILTDQTGVKRSGDVMTGELHIKCSTDAVLALQRNDVRVAVTNAHGSTYEALQIWNVNSGADVSSALTLDISKVGTSYKIYGEHNPPYVVGTYTGNGAANQEIYLGFAPRTHMVTNGWGGEYWFLPAGTDTGFSVDGNYNITGKAYKYIAFK